MLARIQGITSDSHYPCLRRLSANRVRRLSCQRSGDISGYFPNNQVILNLAQNGKVEASRTTNRDIRRGILAEERTVPARFQFPGIRRFYPRNS